MKETIKTVKWLLSFVKKVPFQVFTAVLLGVISYSSVILISYIGIESLIFLIMMKKQMPFLAIIFLVLVLVRGIARYGEQYMNHYIAFHTLANVRHALFKKLRTLAPAKLLSRQKGDYIALITSDVEMLEIFFAHTISPALIGLVMTFGLFAFFASYSLVLGAFTLLIYAILGILLPILQYQKARSIGDNYKEALTNLNQSVIEMSEGYKEVQQYQLKELLLKKLTEKGRKLNLYSLKKENQLMSIETLMQTVIGLSSLFFLLIGSALKINPVSLVILMVVFMSSFGPFIPLSMLGNELLSTFSSAKRLQSIMEEAPVVAEVTKQSELSQATHFLAEGHDLTFAYPHQELLFSSFSYNFGDKGLVGVQGKSGRGKSTLLHLMMRFWEVSEGEVKLNDTVIQKINTRQLHEIEGFMTQSTDLFSGTIKENILLGNKNATEADLYAAAKKASIHEWIMALPDGYLTLIKKGNRDLSDGEKQRIGLARLFLHDAPILLLDEPTSNLDYLNEQLILQALAKEKEKRLVVLVSHRETVLNQVDMIIRI
ncbi:amino acid ABC transporter ATP-binding/permease protein [Vagococcus sp.]|uniref:amino acid ABC transporter ATP-binding/permease protein n=1 Tax=Vagococcus sp. TaxID=1933889 RepID=UPI003F98EE25